MVKRANREAVSDRVQTRIADLHYSGFTDAEIGRRLGVNRSTVGRWGKGQTIPTDAHRRALYGLFRRAAFPRDITSRVVREVITNGVWHDPPLFIQPVSTGRIPMFVNRKRVYGGYVVINAFMQYEDGEATYYTTTIQRRLEPNQKLNDSLVFDGVETEWREQIKAVDDSMKIKNYWVEYASIKLVVAR